MRTYRIQIRLIQLAVVLAAIVVVSGFFGAWGNERTEQPASGENSGKVIIEGTNKINSKIVAIGDSYTYGYPNDPDTAWPKYLQEYLGVEVMNKGKTHQNAHTVLERFDEDVVAEKPGRVIIFVGTGDALQGIPLEEFQKNLQALVEKAKANHIEPILALPMPYRSELQTTLEFREWVLNYAQEQDILVLDFASVLMTGDYKYKEGLSDEKNSNYPSPEGHRVMAEYAARVLK